MRLLLVALPERLPAASQVLVLKELLVLKQASVVSSLLSMPRPPQEAMSRLLHFMADRAKLVFETSRPWPAGRKRLGHEDDRSWSKKIMDSHAFSWILMDSPPRSKSQL